MIPPLFCDGKSVMRRAFVILIVLLLWSVQPAFAHANLSQSVPAANAVLEESPTEIRLWFTEPLEASFSRIRLRDGNGVVLDIGDTQIDAEDSMQMFVPVSELPDGVYTVVWQVVSAADGHPTNGNFAFTIGEAFAAMNAASQSGEAIPLDSTLIRSFHLFSLALVIGGVGFWLFVWKPVVNDAAAGKRLHHLIWIGWIALGVANALMLVLYVSTLTGASLWEALFDHALMDAMATRYGQLLIARGVLWVLLEMMLLAGRKNDYFLWGALLIGVVISVVHGFASHASAAIDSTPAVFMDALHVFATAMWIGGLVQFANALWWAKKQENSSEIVGKFVKYFSNYARVAVIVLIVTGTYTAWLQVGSVNVLLTTTYGQALALKLVLFVPLLLIAGVNLILTPRGLQNGGHVWVERLRGLVGAEIALAIGILIAAGVLTSINTGRAADAQHRALVVEPDMLVTMQITQQYHAHLEISPGWAGENTFSLGLYDLTTTSAVNDATLVRLRFENLSEYMGESELRPTYVGDGVYRATGANFSVPGRWRIRMTLQRPNMYDTVLDFTLTVPPVPPAPTIDMTIPTMERVIALAVAGIACFIVGGFVAAEKRLRLLNGAGVLAIATLILGVICVVGSAAILN
jgi:copper transport protein